MTTERDKPGRQPHRDHAGRADTPRAGIPTVEVDLDTTMDDAIVSGVIDPDDTPIDALILKVRSKVGLLSARDEQIIREVDAHNKRGHERRDRSAPVHFDPDQFKHDLREGMEEWEPFKELRRKVDACDKDREDRAKWRKRAAWVGSLLSGCVLTVLVWAVRSLDARADAGAEERLRVQMIYRHETAIRVLELKQAELIGTIRARLRPVPVPEPDNDRGEP